jgi:hypothetical protein
MKVFCLSYFAVGTGFVLWVVQKYGLMELENFGGRIGIGINPGYASFTKNICNTFFICNHGRWIRHHTQ